MLTDDGIIVFPNTPPLLPPATATAVVSGADQRVVRHDSSRLARWLKFWAVAPCLLLIGTALLLLLPQRATQCACQTALRSLLWT